MPNKVENDGDFSCLADLGGIFQMLGGVIILASQLNNIIAYLSILQQLSSVPPSELPGIEFYLFITRIVIGVAILIGSMLLIAGVISIWRSGPLGGFLAIIFASPSFVVLGLTYYVAPVLAIIGGILSIAPSIRRPKQKTKRPHKTK
ncbi:MAG: hypothetical protein ACFE89_11360 [Candidatus Hodarchaeota archaeon]